MKRIIFNLLIVILCFTLLGCISSSDNESRFVNPKMDPNWDRNNPAKNEVTIKNNTTSNRIILPVTENDTFVIVNKADCDIDISYLCADSDGDYDPDNTKYYGIFHRALTKSSSTHIVVSSEKKCIIETGNGYITYFTLSKEEGRKRYGGTLTLTIHGFTECEVDLLPKRITSTDLDQIYTYNQDAFLKEDTYLINAKFKYDAKKNTLVVGGDYDYLSSNDYDSYLEKYPGIKVYTDFTDESYTCIFHTYGSGQLILTEIEGMDLHYLELVEKAMIDNVVFRNYVYPKISSDIQQYAEALSFRNINFLNNNPYGFSDNCYYYDETHFGYVVQWLTEGSCLYDFGPDTDYVERYIGLTYIEFDNTITNYPFNKNILYHYEGVFSYTSTSGSRITIPKFKVIYPWSSDSTEETIEDESEIPISWESDFFRNNNPYGLSKTCVYYENQYFDVGKVIQWLEDGCLYDFGANAYRCSWSCVSYIIIPEGDRNSFFDSKYMHYYVYEGAYTYETTSGAMNTIPKLRLELKERN